MSNFKFKHLYTVSDGVDKGIENRKSPNDFFFKWLHWSFLINDDLLLTTDERCIHLFKLKNENCTYFKSIYSTFHK